MLVQWTGLVILRFPQSLAENQHRNPMSPYLCILIGKGEIPVMSPTMKFVHGQKVAHLNLQKKKKNLDLFSTFSIGAKSIKITVNKI